MHSRGYSFAFETASYGLSDRSIPFSFVLPIRVHLENRCFADLEDPYVVIPYPPIRFLHFSAAEKYGFQKRLSAVLPSEVSCRYSRYDANWLIGALAERWRELCRASSKTGLGL
jgi:hypothetical protein